MTLEDPNLQNASEEVEFHAPSQGEEAELTEEQEIETEDSEQEYEGEDDLDEGEPEETEPEEGEDPEPEPTYELKIDGEIRKYTSQQLVEQAQLGIATQKRFDEAASSKKQVLVELNAAQTVRSQYAAALKQAETELEGLIDLVTMKEWLWQGEDLGASWIQVDIRDDLKDLADEWRGIMVEAAVEQDDDAMEAYLEGEEPDVATLRKLLRKGTLDMAFVPMLAGSAFKNKGVQPLLNAVIDYLPSPLDVVDYMGFKPGDEEEVRDIPRRADDTMPFAGLAFKIMNDPFVGTLTFTRLYSGVINKGDSVLNATKGRKERIGRMMMMHSNNREEIEEAFAGDIIALAGLKETTTGDTLCDVKEPVVLETMTFPDPVIEIAIEPKTKGDQEKMSLGLQRLAAEDPSFRVETDIESGQTIMRGMGELHLDILVDRLKREFKVEANIGAPQVAYRETLSHEVEHTYTHKKQSGGSGQFGEVKMVISPTEPGEGYSFESKIVGGSVPKEYIPGVEKGIVSVMDSGPLAGFPVIDFKVALIDGKYHDVDSSVLAFEIAARMCMREGMRKAGAKLLEPIMKVEVITPEEYTGGIIGDLTSRRGQVQGQDSRGNAIAIDAFVPLANMFGYINTLRSMSSGRAQFSMLFDHYEAVPGNISEEIQAKYA